MQRKQNEKNTLKFDFLLTPAEEGEDQSQAAELPLIPRIFMCACGAAAIYS
jgi:hypothetical protein